MERTDKTGGVDGPRREGRFEGGTPAPAEAAATEAEATEAEATEAAVESAEAQADGVPYDDEIADGSDGAPDQTAGEPEGEAKSEKSEPKNRPAEG